MVSPSDASSPAGTSSRNRVRYQDVPGTAVASGTGRVDQPASGKPGRYQPARSPYRPPLFTGPRTVSTMDSPPALPCTRHDGVTAVPSVALSVAAIRPRPSFCASLTAPSSLCESSRTITDTSCGPGVARPAGSVNVAVPVVGGALTPVGSTFCPRYAPSTQTCSMPAPPPP